MKKFIIIFLSVSLCSLGCAQDRRYTYQQTEFASTSSTAMWMMAWGLGLVVGIAVACAAAKNSRS